VRGEGGRWDPHYNTNRQWDYRNEEYWQDEPDYRRRNYNNKGTERYMTDARRKKHDADKIQPAGIDKAKAYMESVVLFMLYGDSTEVYICCGYSLGLLLWLFGLDYHLYAL